MLSEEERQEIERELQHCDRKSAASVEALKIVQKHRGWVSDEGIRDVAEILGMTVDELDAVATFYNLIFRKPVGRHVILLCNTISCWVMGYEGILDHLSGLLGITWGETTADGMFTLLPVPCLGACDQAPAMMVDGELYGDLTPEGIDEILGRYRGEEGVWNVP
ncbi:MAG: NADH-quinone oxidoreductase subunit NuoE [Alphaproteobacteria bacterium]|uniref:NADH-quinone oxidoreductase subunit NuoE n=1 Tax=Candidatus Nitrobium versatile TaxID=2884831 RepID=A0A953JE81_9BACT|nr:NADH-quinone oxidoreductase subunit NuoE [Candidatus Nitrobium versatile]